MSKDPAFLFYSDNFQSGTQFFTDEQVGKYIRLLCAQHLHGHLTEKQVLLICKTNDADTKEILAKFRQDEHGKYYNERLEIEVTKRKLFSESRANNRLGKTKKQVKKIRKTSVKHLGNENGNGNEDINGIENGKTVLAKIEYGKPEINELMDFLKEQIKVVDGSVKDNRNYCNLLLNKIKKTYPEQNAVESIKLIIQEGLKDEFHGKNIVGFKYLYYHFAKIFNSVKIQVEKQNKDKEDFERLKRIYDNYPK